MIRFQRKIFGRLFFELVGGDVGERRQSDEDLLRDRLQDVGVDGRVVVEGVLKENVAVIVRSEKLFQHGHQTGKADALRQIFQSVAKQEQDVRRDAFEEERIDESFPLLFVQSLEPGRKRVEKGVEPSAIS